MHKQTHAISVKWRSYINGHFTSTEMTMSVRSCLSYDPLKWNFFTFKRTIILIWKHSVDEVVNEYLLLTSYFNFSSFPTLQFQLLTPPFTSHFHFLYWTQKKLECFYFIIPTKIQDTTNCMAQNFDECTLLSQTWEPSSFSHHQSANFAWLRYPSARLRNHTRFSDWVTPNYRIWPDCVGQA